MTAAVDHHRDQAKFLAQYAKQYHAGAFATPLPRDLPGNVLEWNVAGRTVVYGKRLTSDSTRSDWTGTRRTIPKGSMVALVVARDEHAAVPDFAPFDYLITYVEDRHLTRALRAQGRPIVFTQISAASEIRACWGPPDATPQDHIPADRANLTLINQPVPHHLRDNITAELNAVSGWTDDFPYYSDGSWSALNLRGYRPDDPTWGIKPSEMPRKWQQQHPEALNYTCDWTTLGNALPATRDWINSITWWTGLERVRLLRMAGTGNGQLGRHTDITDRAAGTRDHQITRFHVPLHTHPDILMHHWTLTGQYHTAHLQPWNMYYLDARKPHAVTNPTTTNRVHLVVDVPSNPAVRDQLAHSTEV